MTMAGKRSRRVLFSFVVCLVGVKPQKRFYLWRQRSVLIPPSLVALMRKNKMGSSLISKIKRTERDTRMKARGSILLIK